jgi:hypothetical protein
MMMYHQQFTIARPLQKIKKNIGFSTLENSDFTLAKDVEVMSISNAA